MFAACMCVCGVQRCDVTDSLQEERLAAMASKERERKERQAAATASFERRLAEQRAKDKREREAAEARKEEDERKREQVRGFTLRALFCCCYLVVLFSSSRLRGCIVGTAGRRNEARAGRCRDG